MNTPLGRLQIITPMLGRHAAYNVLAGEDVDCGAAVVDGPMVGRSEAAPPTAAKRGRRTVFANDTLSSTPSCCTLPFNALPCPSAAAAVSLGIACGVPLKAIVAGIEAVDIVPGRCEIIDEGQPFAVVVSRSECCLGQGLGCREGRAYHVQCMRQG